MELIKNTYLQNAQKILLKNLTITKNSVLAGLDPFQDLIVTGDWLIIDGSRPKSEISKIIWENVSNLISQKKFGH